MASNDLVTELRKRDDVMQVHSSIENAAPIIKVRVDPVAAQAEGLTPASIGSMLYSNLSGVEAATMRVNGEDIDVIVEFAPDRYDSIEKVQGMMILLPRERFFLWKIWQILFMRTARSRFHVNQSSIRYPSPCSLSPALKMRQKRL